MLKYQNENIGNSFEYRHRMHLRGYVIYPHIHEYSEILYVYSGCMHMILDGEEVQVKEGQVAFIFPNQLHEYTNQKDCKCWCAVFSNDFLQPFFRLYSDKIPKDPIIDIGEDVFIIERLQKSARDDIVSLTGLLHLLFDKLAKSTDFELRRGGENSLYTAAINYISTNFRSDINLSDMAKTLGYHEKYLSSELHSLTKMNFRLFLATYRVDHAKRQLRTTEESISEIAMDSGFLSINTFNRVFKNITGMTPSEYRNKK